MRKTKQEYIDDIKSMREDWHTIIGINRLDKWHGIDKMLGDLIVEFERYR